MAASYIYPVLPTLIYLQGFNTLTRSCLYYLFASLSYIRSQVLPHDGEDSSRRIDQQRALYFGTSDMARTTRLSSLRRRSGGASSHGISNATLGNDSSSVQSGSQGSSSFSTRQKQNGGSSTDDSTVIIAVVAVAIMVGIICFALWGRRMMRRNRQQRLLRQARLASLDSKPEMWDISLDSATLRDREGLEWRNITPIAVNVFGDTHQIERIYNLFSSAPAKPQWEPQPLHERTVGRIPNESHKIVKDEDICVRIMVAIAMPSCRRRKSGTDGEPLELCLGIAEARWNERDRESSLN